VALKLAVHIGGQIEVGELQQLDGLHQLRRHDERLALPELESLRQRHRISATLARFLLVEPSAYTDIGPLYTQANALSLTVGEGPARLWMRVGKRLVIPDGVASRARRQPRLHPEFLTEIEPADLGVVDDVLGAALHQHFARIDDV